MPSMEEQSEYWCKVWDDRIQNNGSVVMNGGKITFLLQKLWNMPYLASMEKLEIGCGTGIHAIRLGIYNPLWRSRWTGVDLSDTAIQYAKNHDLNVFRKDIFEFDGNGKKYSAFLLLDSLEHFEDRSKLAIKIRELADEEYLIVGNVPLYLSEHTKRGAVENPIDVHAVKQFLTQAGCINSFVNGEIYGIDGLPYMFFETNNKNKDYSGWCR